MKCLAFTPSWRRPALIRGCKLGVAAQSHPIDHSIYLADGDQKMRDRLLLDLIRPNDVVEWGPNLSQHRNYLAALRALGPRLADYDLFFKCDDDDIFLKDYVSEAVAFHAETKCNVSSCESAFTVNGRDIHPDRRMMSLGPRPGDWPYRMEATFVFDQAGLKTILEMNGASRGFEDRQWQHAWMAAGLKIMIRPPGQFGYHIHGDNVSTGSWLSVQSPFQIGRADVAWGSLGLHGHLGFDSKLVEINGVRRLQAFGAHAPSNIEIGAAPGLLLELQGALNDSVPQSQRPVARFSVIDSGTGLLMHDLGEASPGSATPKIQMRVPAGGKLRLKVDTNTKGHCHSVWLWNTPEWVASY